MRNARPPLKIELSTGQAFWVGLHAHEWGRPVENVDYDRLSGAPEMHAILYATLTQYIKEHGPMTSPVVLYVGMPLEPLTGDSAAATLSAVRTWLTGLHCWQAGGETHQVEVSAVKFGKPENWLRGNLAMNCEGRLRPEVGCDWTLGGLFRIHKLEVVADGEATPVFEFADMA